MGAFSHPAHLSVPSGRNESLQSPGNFGYGIGPRHAHGREPHGTGLGHQVGFFLHGNIPGRIAGRQRGAAPP